VRPDLWLDDNGGVSVFGAVRLFEALKKIFEKNLEAP
jgi:hypothetical protein